jgi:hypothetical protein
MDNFMNGFNNRFRNFNQDLTNSFFGSNGAFSMSLWDQAFDTIYYLGVRAFRAIGDEIGRAIDYQNDLISTASAYQGLLNISFGEAEKLAKRSNIIFQSQNASLPFQQLGSQFRAAYGDDILSALYDKDNIDGSLSRTATMIGRLQVLMGSISGVTNYQRASFLSNALSSDYKHLNRLEVLRNSPQMSRAFNQEVANVGGVDIFNKLDRNERIKLLERVANAAISEDVISAYSNSLGGIFSRIMLQFFGDIGIFSFTREIFGEADNNVISSLTGLFKELFNPRGIFGLFFQFLKGVADGFLITLKTAMDVAVIVLKPLNMLAMVLSPLAPLVYGLSTALTVLATIGLAKATASTIANIATNGVGGILGRVGLGFLAPGAGVIGSMINPANIMKGLGGLISSGSTTVVNGFLGLGAGIKAFSTSLVALAANPVFWVVAGVVGAIALAGYTMWKYWKPLGMFFNGFWEGFLEGLEPASLMMDGFNEVLVMIGKSLSPIADGFDSIFSSMKPVLDAIATFFNLQQEEGSRENFDAGKAIGKGAGNIVKFGVGGLLTNPLINPFHAFFKFPSFASGNDPYGFMDAVNRESRAMPTGSKLALANNSEMIIPRSQQGIMGNNYSFNPTVIVNGNSNANIANDVTNALNIWWQQAKLENI